MFKFLFLFLLYTGWARDFLKVNKKFNSCFFRLLVFCATFPGNALNLAPGIPEDQSRVSTQCLWVCCATWSPAGLIGLIGVSGCWGVVAVEGSQLQLPSGLDLTRGDCSFQVMPSPQGLALVSVAPVIPSHFGQLWRTIPASELPKDWFCWTHSLRGVAAESNPINLYCCC